MFILEVYAPKIQAVYELHNKLTFLQLVYCKNLGLSAATRKSQSNVVDHNCRTVFEKMFIYMQIF